LAPPIFSIKSKTDVSRRSARRIFLPVRAQIRTQNLVGCGELARPALACLLPLKLTNGARTSNRLGQSRRNRRWRISMGVRRPRVRTTPMGLHDGNRRGRHRHGRLGSPLASHRLCVGNGDERGRQAETITARHHFRSAQRRAQVLVPRAGNGRKRPTHAEFLLGVQGDHQKRIE